MVNHMWWLVVVLGVLVSTTFATAGNQKRKYAFGCKLPEEPMYGHFEFNKRMREITYHCDDGYDLYGMDVEYRKCMRNRKWSGQHGDCIANFYATQKCQAPSKPRHGSVTFFENDDGTGEAYFTCDLGYQLVGARKLTCISRNQWVGGRFPTCRNCDSTVENFANCLREDFIDPLASATGDSKDSRVTGKLAAGKTGLDIVLLLDVSASIGPKALKTAKDFIKLIIEEFGISKDPTGGKNGTRIALLTFSDKVERVFEIDDASVRSVNAAVKKVDTIKNAGGGTNLKDALNDVVSISLLQLEFTPEQKARFEHSTRAVFVVTDAEATFTKSAKDNTAAIETHSKTLKAAGFEIFCIGVGQTIDYEILETIASKPTDEHVFLTQQFADLGRVRDIIAEKNIDYGQCGISGDYVSQTATETKRGAFPWLGWVGVMMLKDEEIGSPDQSFTCGGALLCDRWFLTVAHCVSYRDVNGTVHAADVRMINVNLGDHHIFKTTNTKTTDSSHIIMGVQKVFLHPNYTGEVTSFGVRKYDVALLDLGYDTAAPLNKYIRPLCFPTPNPKKDNDSDVHGVSKTTLDLMLSKTDQQGFVAGWGHAPVNTELALQPWDALAQDRRAVQPHSRCRKRFPGIDENMFFCVFNSFGESTKCRGDIGGPFMDEMTNNRFTVLGLAARTHDCEEKHGFSIFLNVIQPAISDWVGKKLDGCNRVKEDPTWAERMKKKRQEIEKKRQAEKEALEKKRKEEEAARKKAQEELEKKRKDEEEARKKPQARAQQNNGGRNKGGRRGKQQGGRQRGRQGKQGRQGRRRGGRQRGRQGRQQGGNNAKND